MKGIPALVDYRTRNRLTQVELAKLLDVTSITVSRWEIGERKVGLKKLNGVAEKTGIPKRELRPDLADLISEDRE
jgi:transcriptional regulator with XRE-family HTH domain